MSAVIYLATASERIREFFIVAAFRVPQKTYQNGAYGDGKRSWYTTPFLEALSLPKSSPELAGPLSKAYPLAEQIRELRDTRNALIHELATAIGRRERQLFQERPETVEREDLKFEDFQKFTKAAEARIEQQISDTTKRLAEWYTLLAKLSNEAFIVEHKRRPFRVQRRQIDGDVATQRAFVMTAIVLLGVMLDRQALTLRTLAVAALTVMVATPEAVVHPSFQSLSAFSA